jgi:hypothetical protein
MEQYSVQSIDKILAEGKKFDNNVLLDPMVLNSGVAVIRKLISLGYIPNDREEFLGKLEMATVPKMDLIFIRFRVNCNKEIIKYHLFHYVDNFSNDYIRIFGKYNMSFNAKMGQGTIFTNCISYNRPSYADINYMLEHGADPTFRDSEGKNALDYAELRKYRQEVIDLIRKYSDKRELIIIIPSEKK